MQSDKDIPGISCGLVNSNIFEWEVMLMLSDEQDSLYGGESLISECINLPVARYHSSCGLLVRALAQIIVEMRCRHQRDLHADVRLSQVEYSELA
jgi:hypothetical protein